MTNYRVSLQGVDSTLKGVRECASDLASAFDAAWRDVPSASGGSRVVATALEGFAELCQDEARDVAQRLEDAPGAVVRAVGEILQGDEEMADEHARAASSVSPDGPVFGPPTGVFGPPVPPSQLPDPGRPFGAPSGLPPIDDGLADAGFNRGDDGRWTHPDGSWFNPGKFGGGTPANELGGDGS